MVRFWRIFCSYNWANSFLSHRDLSLGLTAWLPAFWIVRNFFSSLLLPQIFCTYLPRIPGTISFSYPSLLHLVAAKVQNNLHWFFSAFLFCSSTFINWMPWTWWKTHILQAVCLPALPLCISAFGILSWEFNETCMKASVDGNSLTLWLELFGIFIYHASPHMPVRKFLEF